jgi:type I restriction enzyme S subunit
MSSWRSTTLGELVDVLDSQRRPVNSDERGNRVGDVPYYGANGQQGWIDRPLFNEPLILLAEDGGNFDDSTTRPIAYRIDGPSWVNNHAHIIRAKRGTDQSFLFWTLVHRDIRRFISGGTRTKLTQAEMRSIQLKVPVLWEQHQIAIILDTLDDQIRATKQIITKLNCAKQGLLTDVIPAFDRRDEPDGWHQVSLADVTLKIQDGTHFSPSSTSGPRMYVTSRNIRMGYMNLSNAGHISESEHRSIYRRCDVKPGDLLLTKDGANTGNVCINDCSEEFSLLSSVALLRPNPSIVDRRFLQTYLAFDQTQKRLTDAMSGNAITRLTLRKIKAFEIVVPPIRSQKRIADLVASCDKRVKAEYDISVSLSALKQGLITDLMSGRVRVPMVAAL